MKARRKRIIAILLILAALYAALTWFLVSAALVPSFMRRLSDFERITKKSYTEQVQDTALQQNYRAAQAIGRIWAEKTPHERVTMMSEDGYELVAMVFRQESAAAESSAGGAGGAGGAPGDAVEAPGDAVEAPRAASDAPGSAVTPDVGAQPASHKWVITLHGYTGWKEAMYPFAAWYYGKGYNVLAPDLRCQGESEGDFIGMGWTDRLDVLGWIRMIESEDPEAQIVLHGQSMGAACALLLSGMDELPSGVMAVVSDCAYTDAVSMFSIKIRDWFHLPAFPLVDSANLMLQLRGGYNLRDAAPIKAVRRSKVPILYIHGEEDRMIPVEMVRRLKDNTAGPSWMIIIPGAGHAQAADADPVVYYGTVEEFLWRCGA